MRPSFSRFLLSQSRWQLDRKRNRKGLKDLLLLSFSFKDKCPSDNFPQCSLHTGLRDQWLWESAGIWQITASTRGTRGKKKEVGLLLSVSTTYPPRPPSLSLVALHFAGSIWVHLSRPRQAGGPLCPLGLQGLSVLQCGSLLLWKRGARACPLARLDHLKGSVHPFPCFARPPAHPRCPEAWLV